MNWEALCIYCRKEEKDDIINQSKIEGHKSTSAYLKNLHKQNVQNQNQKQNNQESN